MLAVDIDEQRLSRVYDNLKRLGMKATVKQGDGRYPAQWCGEQQFDRILLDAPCSATGVIRRHPDIKWLRRDRDIAELAQLQAEILDAVWPRLKLAGRWFTPPVPYCRKKTAIRSKPFCNALPMPRSAKREHLISQDSKICRAAKKVMGSLR